MFVKPSHNNIWWIFGLLSFFSAGGIFDEFCFSKIQGFHFVWFVAFSELACFVLFGFLTRALLIYFSINLSGLQQQQQEEEEIPEEAELLDSKANKDINDLHYNVTSSSCTAATKNLFSHKADFIQHFFVALIMTLSKGTTILSLDLMTFSSQVVFKSLKLPTVMIGSVFMLKSNDDKNKYGIRQYVSAILLVISAIMFGFGDQQSYTTHQDVVKELTFIGIFVVLSSLIFDSWHSNAQHKLLHYNKASTLETIIFTNLFGALNTLIISWISGEFWNAVQFCITHPIVILILISRALFIFCGVICFVNLIVLQGIVEATAITTIRKILTLFISFLIFPKGFSSYYVLGLVTFSLSVFSSYLKVPSNKTLVKQDDIV